MAQTAPCVPQDPLRLRTSDGKEAGGMKVSCSFFHGRTKGETLSKSRLCAFFLQGETIRFMPMVWLTIYRACSLGHVRVTMVTISIAIGLASSIWAQETEPTYPFPTAPGLILERLGEMKLGEPAPLDAREWELLEGAWAWRDSSVADKQTQEYGQLVVKLLLASSGVVTEAAQTPYIEYLQKLIAEARVAIDLGKPATHPGESLMKFLHDGVMHGGYDLDQSSFSTVFETGIYNCVSSSAVYFVIGRELGFDMQIISIAGSNFTDGHACLNLIDGDRIYEVEPTNPSGFDWATKLSQPGVFTVGFQPD